MSLYQPGAGQSGRQQRGMMMPMPMQMPFPGQGAPGGFPGFPGGDAGEKQGESLWRMVDDRLRGRWKWMVLIALVGALLLGGLGYKSAVPLYVSQGAIEVTPKAQSIRGPIEESVIPNYAPFRDTQVHHIRSQRVLERALQDEKLSQLPWAQQGNALGNLKSGLKVEADPRTHLIWVSFESTNPVVAMTAVNAVMKAYDETFGQTAGLNVPAKLRQLDELISSVDRQLKYVFAERQELYDRHQTTDLGALEAKKLAEIDQQKQKIVIGRKTLERLDAKENASSASLAPPTMEQLEAFDARLAALRQERDIKQTEFDHVKRGFLPGSRVYIQAERALQDASAVHADHLKKVTKVWEERGGVPLSDNVDSVYAGMNREQIEQELASATAVMENLNDDTRQIITDRQRLAQLTEEEARLRKELDDTKTRKRNLEIELPSLVFITVAQDGYLPPAPDSDARFKRAVMGGAFACFASFAMFFVIGTIDRRAYGAAQLNQASIEGIPSCLGVLPDLGANLNDPEVSDVASHCVHQIRNQIEAVREPGDGYVMAFSSPFQGDGKTSIVMSLGWSYAAAGYRTLVVDCDLVGRSLTRQFGLIGREGLKEVLLSKKVNGELAKLQVDHLSALPVGVNTRFGPETVRRADLERLFDELRRQFDIILVDTGPLLGSLESTPVTAAADGVVLSVRRGRSRTRLEECVNRLEAVGANCLGVILNCAVRSDCNRYVSEASLAAAEDGRAGRAGDAQVTGSMVHTPAGERNALMVAMENSSRVRESNES
jgi:Mrp family chromosome partitioning ATPase/uncharacterized protein involved in exopolysaccharide biosynthesis